MTRALAASSLLVLSALAAPAVAQPTPRSPGLADARWAPFLGCWRATSDLTGTGTRVCVEPAGDGVTVTTLVGGQRVAEEVRIADGTPRAVASDGCRGTASAHWSDNGFRLYRSATVACDGGAPRTLTTAAFFLAGPVWVDVETVDAAGTASVRVSRLVPSGSLQPTDGTPPVARLRGRGLSPEATAGFTVPDVIELSGALPADGVQAALTEAPARYRLNAKALIAMADAGVGDRVIDLMVGLTYPAKFEVRRAGPASWASPGGSSMADPYFAPLVGSAALFNCYSSYGWATSNYWGNCAGYGELNYSMYPGYYSGYLGPYGAGWIVTQPGGGSAAPQSEGRLVNGRGYTQVRPVDTTYIGGGNGGTNSGQTTSGGSSGDGGASGSGYSGGAAGGDGGGRTAVPRGPGGTR